MSEKRWALVCTVGNNLGEEFPHQQVLAFPNEKEAIWYAADLLCKHDECVEREGDGIYRYHGQHWTAAQLIVEWRETNLDTELFHIWELSPASQEQRSLINMPCVNNAHALLVDAAAEINALQKRLNDALGIAHSSNAISMAIVDFLRDQLARESAANVTTKT